MKQILTIAFFAATSFMLAHVYFSEKGGNHVDVAPPELADLSRSLRSLGLDQYSDPKSTIIAPHVNSTITIYVAGLHVSNSIFYTGYLPRYGSGRFNFQIQDVTQCGETTCATPLTGNSPCLAVRLGRDKKCVQEHLKCNYPECKTMVTDDEWCKESGYDIRSYFSATIPNQGYLPLGPRIDSWQSLENIRANPQFALKPSSQRKFAFNAIFSKDTNSGREELANVIEGQHGKSSMPILVSIAKKYKPHPNNPGTAQMTTESYMNALLDSAFTIAPGGHNPECFRMFEAVEAGSIPVLIKNDLYVDHACKEALHHWYDSPILVLDSWDDLFPTIERLMGNLEAMDQLQADLRMWYDGYVRKIVRSFEDKILEPQITVS